MHLSAGGNSSSPWGALFYNWMHFWFFFSGIFSFSLLLALSPKLWNRWVWINGGGDCSRHSWHCVSLQTHRLLWKSGFGGGKSPGCCLQESAMLLLQILWFFGHLWFMEGFPSSIPATLGIHWSTNAIYTINVLYPRCAITNTLGCAEMTKILIYIPGSGVQTEPGVRTEV